MYIFKLCFRMEKKMAIVKQQRNVFSIDLKSK